MREEDLGALPASATLVGVAAPGLSLEAVGELAAAVAGIKKTGEDGSPPPLPLYELCVNDCRHFVDDLASSACGTRVRAVREASRAHWRQERDGRGPEEEEEEEKKKGSVADSGSDGGGVRGGEVVVAASSSSSSSSLVPFPAALSSLADPQQQQEQPPSSSSLSFSPLREQKQQEELEKQLLLKQKKEKQQQREHRHRSGGNSNGGNGQKKKNLLHRGAGDAALRAAQLLTDVDHWPAVAAAGKALALGALSAAVTRPAAALLPCAALSILLPQDVKPAAGVAAAAVLRAPLDLAGAALRQGRAAAGAALRAARAGLGGRRRRANSESGGCDGGRNLAIPGLR